MHGLEQYFGGGSAGAKLADVMGPDPEIAKSIDDGFTLWVCENCAMENNIPVGTMYVYKEEE